MDSGLDPVAEKKRLRFLLGPLKHESVEEMEIYKRALLFRSTPADQATVEEEESDGTESSANAASSAIDNSNAAVGTSNASQSDDMLFTALQCSARSMRLQQTFNMWKAPLDIGWEFRRMKKRKTIALQPLDSFPDFLHEFNFKGQRMSFFQFLQEFTRLYFYGFNVDVMDPINMAEAKWSVTSRYILALHITFAVR